MKPSEMKVWPQEAPEEMGDGFLIWLPDSGYQITKYDNDHGRTKKPYFYWCGSPKKVWWVKLGMPDGTEE